MLHFIQTLSGARDQVSAISIWHVVRYSHLAYRVRMEHGKALSLMTMIKLWTMAIIQSPSGFAEVMGLSIQLLTITAICKFSNPDLNDNQLRKLDCDSEFPSLGQLQHQQTVSGMPLFSTPYRTSFLEFQPTPF